MQYLLEILGALIVIILIIITIKCVIQLSGRSKEEANEIVQKALRFLGKLGVKIGKAFGKEIAPDLFKEEVPYDFSSDSGFNNDVSTTVRNIIGDKRYEKLMRLMETAIDMPLLFFKSKDGLPCIFISVSYSDETEKQYLETTLRNLVRRNLGVHGLNQQTIAKWETRPDLSMPCLAIQYARTAEESQIMGRILQYEREEILSTNRPIYDETEDDDLYE